MRQRLEFKIGRMAEVLEDSSLRVSPLPMDPDEGDEEDQGGLDEGDVRALLLSLGGRA